MKFTYDRETDSLYIHFSDEPGADTHVLSDELVLDIDSTGKPVGLDVQHASRVLDVTKLELQGMPLANLLILREDVLATGR